MNKMDKNPKQNYRLNEYPDKKHKELPPTKDTEPNIAIDNYLVRVSVISNQNSYETYRIQKIPLKSANLINNQLNLLVNLI